MHYKAEIGWHMQQAEGHLRAEEWRCLEHELQDMLQDVRHMIDSQQEQQDELLAVLNPYPKGRW